MSQNLAVFVLCDLDADWQNGNALRQLKRAKIHAARGAGIFARMKSVLRGQNSLCAAIFRFARTCPGSARAKSRLRARNPLCALKNRFARAFFTLRGHFPHFPPLFPPASVQKETVAKLLTTVAALCEHRRTLFACQNLAITDRPYKAKNNS